jgi:hypothetical protein
MYGDNVSKMCERLNLVNFITSDAVKIEKIKFFLAGHKIVTTFGTDMNRAGFVYLQEKFYSAAYQVSAVEINDGFKLLAANHFAELWDDAEEINQCVIAALKGAKRLEI